MAEQWFTKVGDEISGPFTSEQVRQKVVQGDLTVANLLSRDKVAWATPGDYGFAVGASGNRSLRRRPGSKGAACAAALLLLIIVAIQVTRERNQAGAPQEPASNLPAEDKATVASVPPLKPVSLAAEVPHVKPGGATARRALRTYAAMNAIVAAMNSYNADFRTLPPIFIGEMVNCEGESTTNPSVRDRNEALLAIPLAQVATTSGVPPPRTLPSED